MSPTGKLVWDPSLNRNEAAFENLKLIEKELNVVLKREKLKRQIRFYGHPEKLPQATRLVVDMLKKESNTKVQNSVQRYEIYFEPDELTLMPQQIIQQFGGEVVDFKFSSTQRKMIINGTKRERKEILSAAFGKKDARPICPICFCEAENPIQTSCKHTYCLECFEECCKTAASTSGSEFQVKCQGDEGACTAVFSLQELQDCVSSSVFEAMLKSSFEEHIQRHPEILRYCPTPDCGYIYRCTENSDSTEAQEYTCPNCFETICTSCHVRHSGRTCKQYQDFISNEKALQELKDELNIKDCPKCKTPMEKTEGCNHMVCPGCKTHICWVCMAMFETSRPCYRHMSDFHGGFGLQGL